MMTSAQTVAMLGVIVLLVLLVLSVVLLTAGALWRFLPFSRGWSELTFVTAAALLLTPVPVGVGVGAMIYPIVVLYQDLGQLKWHFLNWYLETPALFIPSFLITVTLAYVISHRVFPNRTRAKRRGDEL